MVGFPLPCCMRISAVWKHRLDMQDVQLQKKPSRNFSRNRLSMAQTIQIWDWRFDLAMEHLLFCSMFLFWTLSCEKTKSKLKFSPVSGFKRLFYCLFSAPSWSSHLTISGNQMCFGLKLPGTSLYPGLLFPHPSRSAAETARLLPPM